MIDLGAKKNAKTYGIIRARIRILNGGHGENSDDDSCNANNLPDGGKGIRGPVPASLERYVCACVCVDVDS